MSLDKRLNSDRVLNQAYKIHKADIDGVVAGIREESSKLSNPNGISKNAMKVGSIPGDVYDAMCFTYGRFCWKDPKFTLWFLEKYPHFKYNPSSTWTTSRF